MQEVEEHLTEMSNSVVEKTLKLALDAIYIYSAQM